MPDTKTALTKGWENYLKNKRKDILGVSDKDYDLILSKATTVATKLKTTFGSTNIDAARWGDEQQVKLAIKAPPALAKKP